MASTITQVEKLVGKRIRRREDPRLITGQGRYLDDVGHTALAAACGLRTIAA